MDKLKLSRLWPLVAVLLAVFMLSGCQKNRAVFNESVKLSVDSVQAGDMEMADTHLEKARANAKTHEDKRIVQSMDVLVTGAKAMMEGDVAVAKQQWSDIEDPRFNREVRVKADALMGVKVPLIVSAKETEK